MKNILWVLIVLIVIGVGGWFLLNNSMLTEQEEPNMEETATTTEEVMEEKKEMEVIGKSVDGNDIMAYHYGTGSDEILLVGGIHGGYSWNTALVAQEAADYFKENPEVIPTNVMVTVIPVLNPDGLEEVVGVPTATFTAADVPASAAERESGRFNANTVD
ncbi:hypothetical protein COW86_02655, partial [Candidatus Kuenenbacteria bacterium CG22_combo_CG10-13_8_21_14_all_39_9]